MVSALLRRTGTVAHAGVSVRDAGRVETGERERMRGEREGSEVQREQARDGKEERAWATRRQQTTRGRREITASRESMGG